MRKIISAVIIMILVLSGLGAFNVSSQEKKVNIKEISVSFSDLKLTENQEDRVNICLEGANTQFVKNGYYILPTEIETLTFPIGTKINNIIVSPRSVHERIINKEPMVSVEPVLMNQKNVEGNEKNSKNPVSIDTWYNYELGSGILDNERCLCVKLELFPVQFSSSQNSLKWAEKLIIDIEYELPEKTISSYEEEHKFIILSPNEFSSSLQDLVNHKNNRGIATKLITLSDIYYGSFFTPEGRDDAEKIKYFIKNAVENWNTTDVMLVGSADMFPFRATHVYVNYGGGDSEVFASDLYFADIYNETGGFSSWDTNNNDVFGEYDWEGNTDDVDLFADVHLGRLACADSDEVTKVINKIITYESNEAYVQDWFTNLVVIGGDTSPNDEEDVIEGELVNQEIIEIMDSFIPTKCWASEGTLTTRSNVDAAFNAGAGFVDFSGHGNPSSWSTHPHNQDVWIPVGGYKNTNVLSLNNANKLPVVVTGACSVAKFTVRDDCFTWSFVSNPIGGGIAAFGPSSLSWGYTGSYATQGLGGKMQLELFKAYNDYGAITAGEMWSRAINNYISTRMDGGDHKTIEQWQPFCDPTLAIADESLPPVKPDAPDGTVAGKAGKRYTYTAVTTDPEGDAISYLFDWDDGTYSDWTDFTDSGESVTVSHSWDEKGDYDIRVKAKDDHGVQSEWSDPTSISMPKSNIFSVLNYFFENHPNLKHLFISFPFLQI